MSLRKTPLNDTAIAELDALDAAVRGEAVAPEHADLMTLVADVRDTAPAATPAFLAQLDGRVREGFPPRDEAPAKTRAPRRKRWMLVPAGGALAAVVVVALISSGALSGTSSLSSVEDSGESSSLETLDQGLEAPGSAAAPPDEGFDVTGQPLSSRPTESTGKRSVEETAALKLAVPSDEVSSAADEVTRITERMRGIVQSSAVSVGDDTTGEARFELGVPADRLDAAIAAYSEIGRVTGRTQDTRDITQQVRTAERRVSQARRVRRTVEREIRSRQARGESTAELRRTLTRLKARERLEARALRSERARVTMATLSLTVQGDDEAAVAPDDGWSLGDAASDAGDVLETLAGAAIVGGAVLIPVGLLGFGALVGGRAMRRRRRERVLDAT